MTTSADNTFNLDYAGLIRVAYRTAGVLGPYDEPSPEENSAAGEWINVELHEWQTAGRLLRLVERVTKTLTPGTATVTVDADTIDIDFPACITMATGSTDYVVRRMTLDEYLEITNKTQQGTPSRGLVERKDTVLFTLHPVPDSTIASITYVRSRLIKDTDPGFNPEIHTRYLKTLLLRLAVWLAEANGKSADKIQRLENRSEAAMVALRRDNTERGDLRFRLF